MYVKNTGRNKICKVTTVNVNDEIGRAVQENFHSFGIFNISGNTSGTSVYGFGFDKGLLNGKIQKTLKFNKRSRSANFERACNTFKYSINN